MFESLAPVMSIYRYYVMVKGPRLYIAKIKYRIFDQRSLLFGGIIFFIHFDFFSSIL